MLGRPHDAGQRHSASLSHIRSQSRHLLCAMPRRNPDQIVSVWLVRNRPFAVRRSRGGRTYFWCDPEILDATDPDSGLQIVRIDIPLDDLETDSYLATGCGCEWGRGIECVLDMLLRESIIVGWNYQLMDNGNKARWSVWYDLCEETASRGEITSRGSVPTQPIPDAGSRRYVPYNAKPEHFKLASRNIDGITLQILSEDLSTGGTGPDCSECEWGRGIECVLDEMEAKGIIADWGAGWKIILGYRRGFYYASIMSTGRHVNCLLPTAPWWRQQLPKTGLLFV